MEEAFAALASAGATRDLAADDLLLTTLRDFSALLMTQTKVRGD